MNYNNNDYNNYNGYPNDYNGYNGYNNYNNYNNYSDYNGYPNGYDNYNNQMPQQPISDPIPEPIMQQPMMNQGMDMGMQQPMMQPPMEQPMMQPTMPPQMVQQPMNEPMMQSPVTAPQPAIEQPEALLEEPPEQQPVKNKMDGNLYDFSKDLNTKQYNTYGNNMGVSNNTPNKKKKGFSFFAFLEFLIIVFLCLYIANDKGYIHIKFLDNLIPVKENKKQPEEKEEQKNEEIVITDEKIVNDINQNIFYLNSMGVDFSNQTSTIYDKDLKIEDITTEDKLQSIIIGLLKKNTELKDLTEQAEFEEVFADLASNPELKDAIKNIKYIDANKVKDTYKSIYNEELTNTNIESTCPMVVYNEKYNKYYINSICSSESNDKTSYYFNYKITNKDDKYYAYIALAIKKELEDGTYTIYKDKDCKNTYKDFTSEEEFTLNHDNYKEFNHYKITYTKDGDNYSFNSIELFEETK